MIARLNGDLNAWDPYFCVHDGALYVLVLVSQRNRNSSEPWWASCKSAIIWKCAGGKCDAIGCVEAENGSRLCAGSIASVDGELIAYMSETYTGDHSNFSQRLVVYPVRISTNGKIAFSDRPTQVMYSIGRPVTKRNSELRPMYGMRDPYYLRLDDGTHALYYVGGGFRWNCEPYVEVLISSDPYADFTFAERVAVAPADYLNEYERVSVFRHNGEYVMTGHCWGSWLKDKAKILIGDQESDGHCTMWAMYSDNPLGPFSIRKGHEFIAGSEMYHAFGTHVQPLRTHQGGDALAVMAWNLGTKDRMPYTVDDRAFFTIEDIGGRLHLLTKPSLFGEYADANVFRPTV